MRAMISDPRFAGVVRLLGAARRPPSGARPVVLALVMGVLCHIAFTVAVVSMIAAMFFGISESFGQVSWPWALVTNALLVVQFPLAHSFFLTGRGSRWLARLVPGPHGRTLATTTYALIASLQLAALFLLWTPDQLAFVLGLTAYCLLAPRLKERRFLARYGARFVRYRGAVPYAFPDFRPSRRQTNAQ